MRFAAERNLMGRECQQMGRLIGKERLAPVEVMVSRNWLVRG